MLLGSIFFLVAAALIPPLILLFIIYRMDKIEREPVHLLLSLFLQGAIAMVPILILELIGDRIIGIFSWSQMLYLFFAYFVIPGFVEEGVKYLVVMRRAWNDSNFNYTFDAVVYAVFVSLGFALWENVQYVFSYGFGTALVRAFTAVPGHACFGVFMGTWYGLAKKQQLWGREDTSMVCRTMAVMVPMLIHGTYDLIASIGNSWIFVVFIAVMFAISFTTIKRLSNQDHYL